MKVFTVPRLLALTLPAAPTIKAKARGTPHQSWRRDTVKRIARPPGLQMFPYAIAFLGRLGHVTSHRFAFRAGFSRTPI